MSYFIITPFKLFIFLSISKLILNDIWKADKVKYLIPDHYVFLSTRKKITYIN